MVFGRNYGHDKVIVGTGAEDGLDQLSTVSFSGGGYPPTNSGLQARDTDLDISIIGTETGLPSSTGTLIVPNKADEFVTSDGSLLARESVDRLVSAMAVFNPPAMGETQCREMQRAGAIIAAGWQ